MKIAEIIADIENLSGVLTLQPQPGDGSPEISWGDSFFYYAPSGQLPKTQPFATIVTKDYPDEPSSGLDAPGAFRVNIAAGTQLFVSWIGAKPREVVLDDVDFAATDVVLPHPVYGRLGWLCVVNPGPQTDAALLDLLTQAHGMARTRYERRG